MAWHCVQVGEGGKAGKGSGVQGRYLIVKQVPVEQRLSIKRVHHHSREGKQAGQGAKRGKRVGADEFNLIETQVPWGHGHISLSQSCTHDIQLHQGREWGEVGGADAPNVVGADDTATKVSVHDRGHDHADNA